MSESSYSGPVDLPWRPATASIRTRIALLVTSVVVITTVTVGVVNEWRNESELRAIAGQGLQALLAQRASQVDSYATEVGGDLRLLAMSDRLRQIMRELQAGPPLQGASDNARRLASADPRHGWLQQVSGLRGYADLILIHPDGTVLYSVGKKMEAGSNLTALAPGESALADAVVASRAHVGSEAQLTFAEFQIPGDPGLGGFLAFPVVDLGGARLGQLAVQLAPARINAIIRDASGFGASGEVYIVGSDHQRRIPSRFDAASRVNPGAELTESSLRALRGQSGMIQRDDANGRRLLSAFQPLELFGARYAMLAERRLDEVLAPVRELRVYWIAAAAGVALIAMFMGVMVANRTLRPLAAMASVFRQIVNKDLNVVIPVPKRRDELHELATAAERVRAMAVEVREVQELRLQDRAREITLLQTISASANGASNTFGAVRMCLIAVANHLRAPLAHAYIQLPGAAADEIDTDCWYDEDPVRHADFVDASAGHHAVHGNDLRTQVAAARSPVWIIDLQQQSLVRQGAAAVAGLRSAFAFPVLIGQELVAVLEFFLEERRLPPESVDDIAVYASGELARVYERERLYVHAQDLQDQEHKIRMVVERAVGAVITTDEFGTILTFNQHAQELFGHPAESMPGTHINDLLGDAYRDSNDRYLQNVRDGLLRDGTPRERVIEMLRADGSGFPAAIGISWFPLRQGFLFTGIVRDLSADIAARAELEQARDSANEASQAKAQFIAATSHELRTPLNAIIGLSHVGAVEARDGAERARMEDIQSAGERLNAIVQTMLAYSELDTSGKQSTAEPMVTLDLVERVAATARVRAKAKGLAFGLVVDDAVPEVILAEADRLEKLLNELLDNAVKFTSQGRVDFGCHLIAQGDHETTLRFSVADSGIGIAEHDASRAFEAFVQLDQGRNRRFGGTGLGLALARELAQRLGGELKVESKETVGSTFEFTASFVMPAGEQAGIRVESGIMPVSTARAEGVSAGHAGQLAAADLTVTELLTELTALAAMLEDGNPDARSAAVRLAPALSTHGDIALYEQLVGAIDEFEFDEARASLERLRRVVM
ncbi:MAG: ATP-binding protein [Pseudomonadota bacterium]